MSDVDNEAARQENERLRLENNKLREDRLELTDELMSYTGLPGHLHRIDVKMKQLNRYLSALPMRWKKILARRIPN